MLCPQSPLIYEGKNPDNKKFKLGAYTPKILKRVTNKYNFDDRYRN
jgi:hypothetical protein